MRIKDGKLRYRRHDYDLAGATARVESTGWRGQKHQLIIDGQGWQVSVRIPNKNARIAYGMAEAVNNAAGQAAANR